MLMKKKKEKTKKRKTNRRLLRILFNNSSNKIKQSIKWERLKIKCKKKSRITPLLLKKESVKRQLGWISAKKPKTTST